MAYHKARPDAGVMVDSNVLDSFETATSVQVDQAGERIVTDGPFAETREYLGGYYILDLPDLDAAIDWAARCPGARAWRVEVRPVQELRPVSDRRGGRPAPSRRCSGRSGAGCSPCSSPVRRSRPRRGRRLRRDRGRAGALARRRGAGRRRWPGCSPPRAARPSTGCGATRPTPPGWPSCRSRRSSMARRARDRGQDPRCPGGVPRRAAAAVLHLLPPRAGARGPDRADAALPGRAVHAGGGAGVPGARGDDGAADRPGQAQDPRRADPVPGARRRRAARAPARRAARDLPDLHRGLRRQRGRGPAPGRPRRRGDPAGPDPAPAAARRARGERPAGAAAAGRRPPRRPASTRPGSWCRSKTRTAALWDADRIAEGRELVVTALRGPAPGPYALQAAIAALHDEAADVATTDWPQVVALYDVLARLSPSPVVELNRAVARGDARRPAGRPGGAGRAGRPARCAATTCCPAARADLLRRLGRTTEAAAAYRAATRARRQ